MSTSNITPIDLSVLEATFSQLDIQGVKYGLGAKAEGGQHPETGRRFNPRSTGKLSTPLHTITHIDCSGAIRLLAYKSTGGKLIFPDGSQRQREQCEEWHEAGLIKKVNYRDVSKYMTHKRLFIAFIRPGHRGCGPVGHVWFVCQYDDDKAADTLESHGGVGINSRPWDARTLYNQVYSCYELPTVA